MGHVYTYASLGDTAHYDAWSVDEVLACEVYRNTLTTCEQSCGPDVYSGSIVQDSLQTFFPGYYGNVV